MKIERFTPDMPDLELKEKFAEVFELLRKAAIGEGATITWTDDEFQNGGVYELGRRLEKIIKHAFPPRTVKFERIQEGVRFTRKNPPKMKPKKVQP